MWLSKKEIKEIREKIKFLNLEREKQWHMLHNLKKELEHMPQKIKQEEKWNMRQHH